jgi:hypothetical protein
METRDRQYNILAKIAKAQGYDIKFVPDKKVHDFEAMNPASAKVIGYPIASQHTIEIQEGLPIEKQYQDLNHEMIERKRVATGEKYWPAHLYALKHEGDPVDIVQQHDDGDLTVKYDGVNYVVTTDGKAFREVQPMNKVKVTSDSEGKFFHPKVHMDWHKDESEQKRRKKALAAHKGDELSTARALGALANVTQDRATERAARKDAKYFYGRHQREVNLGAGVVRDRRGQHLRMD